MLKVYALFTGICYGGIMKKLSTYLFLFILSFSMPSHADDIQDLQIEGISIGDSALDFFPKNEVDSRKKIGFVYDKKDFYSATFYEKNFFEFYDQVQLHIKKDDDNYIIYSVGGKKIYHDHNIKKCHLDMENALKAIKKLFKNANVRDIGIQDWQFDSRVKVKSYYVQLNTGDEVAIECYDYPVDYQFTDDLTIAIDTEEFVKWLHY